MKNTLRRAFFRYWERTKALQAARVDRGLYKCMGCLNVAKMKGHHIDHIDPVVDPKVGFVNWDTYIARLFCPASNLQLLCEACHTDKTAKERLIRKEYKTGVFKAGRTMPQEQKDNISASNKGRIPDNLAPLQKARRRTVIGTKIDTSESVEFISVTEAARFIGGSVGNISAACKGSTNRTQVKGWKFSYKQEENKKRREIKKLNK